MCATGECSTCEALRDIDEARSKYSPAMPTGAPYDPARCACGGFLALDLVTGRRSCPKCDAGSLACIQCGKRGPLVEHAGEQMHGDCVPAFDALVENRDCASDGVPVLLADDDEEETTPVEPLTNDEIAKLDPLGVFSKEAA